MKIPFKRAVAGAMLLVSISIPARAESIPTVIHAQDVPTLFASLSEKAAPNAVELRELAVLTFIEAANAPQLSKKDVKRYANKLQALADASGGDPEIEAIRATFYGIQAREARSNMDALLLAKKGISALDELVEDHPDNGGVLMQRGLSALYAPSFLGRDGVFVEDFSALLSDRFALPPVERGYVLFNLLKGYQKIGDAEAGTTVKAELQALHVTPWSGLGADLSF
ncbi:hypothetical protein J4E08_08925 [Sagittula sp. NFXS13]|uniref:hypothetical protein n=1 Tax=Sagittula sp. NFXS13 TaxID=2819095 RepID=UPI0032DE9BB5